jgi:peptidoglycan/LPS O-acetylase OafA/YrhL
MLTRLLETRVLFSVGLISYSLFLWNEPVLRWLTNHGVMQPGWSGFGANVLIAAVAVGVLSVATYRLVEIPALRRKRRSRGPPCGSLRSSGRGAVTAAAEIALSQWAVKCAR